MANLMNCKPGQNTIVVGEKDNAGRIGQTLSIARPGETFVSTCGSIKVTINSLSGMTIVYGNQVAIAMHDHGELWVMSRTYEWAFTDARVVCELPIVPDKVLRPLLDIEGEDEMVTIAGLPIIAKELEKC